MREVSTLRFPIKLNVDPKEEPSLSSAPPPSPNEGTSTSLDHAALKETLKNFVDKIDPIMQAFVKSMLQFIDPTFLHDLIGMSLAIKLCGDGCNNGENTSPDA